MNTPHNAILIGAGNRGAEVYGKWAADNPEKMKIIAVAEPNPSRLKAVARQHQIPESGCFDSYKTLLASRPEARAAIITTQDDMHTAPALMALEAGYNVLLEKPMAPTPEECVSLVKKAEETKMLLMICHVMRFSPDMKLLKSIVASGELGQIITVSHRENVSSWHMAHSFVRGNWRREEDSNPMILAKSCHDLDMLVWLLEDRPETLHSVGNLRHYRVGSAPPGAPIRCTDGCPVEKTCPFFAPSIYIDLAQFTQALKRAKSPLYRLAGKMKESNPALLNSLAVIIPALRDLTDYSGWPRSIITDHPTDEAALWEALRTGPYGRCVYHCDNTVVDHQIVSMGFEKGTSVSFTMHGHSDEEGRTIRIDGSQKSLFAKFGFFESFIEIRDHRDFSAKRISLPNHAENTGHGGGDAGLMNAFVDALDGKEAALTDAWTSLESHLMAFAAEQSRLSGESISMKKYRKDAGLI